MRRIDKKINLAKVNKLAEQRHLRNNSLSEAFGFGISSPEEEVKKLDNLQAVYDFANKFGFRVGRKPAGEKVYITVFKGLPNKVVHYFESPLNQRVPSGQEGGLDRFPVEYVDTEHGDNLRRDFGQLEEYERDMYATQSPEEEALDAVGVDKLALDSLIDNFLQAAVPNEIEFGEDAEKRNVIYRYIIARIPNVNSGLNENFEVIYSDGMKAMKKFKNGKSAYAFTKELITSNPKLKHAEIFKADQGFHSTTQEDKLMAWWGNGSSYWDNVAKRNPELNKKKIKV